MGGYYVRRRKTTTSIYAGAITKVKLPSFHAACYSEIATTTNVVPEMFLGLNKTGYNGIEAGIICIGSNKFNWFISIPETGMWYSNNLSASPSDVLTIEAHLTYKIP